MKVAMLAEKKEGNNFERDKLNLIWEEISGCFYIQPSSTGEQKTKPTQNSVRELRGLGLSPDLVGTLTVCTKPLTHTHVLTYSFVLPLLRLCVVAKSPSSSQ